MRLLKRATLLQRSWRPMGSHTLSLRTSRAEMTKCEGVSMNNFCPQLGPYASILGSILLESRLKRIPLGGDDSDQAIEELVSPRHGCESGFFAIFHDQRNAIGDAHTKRCADNCDSFLESVMVMLDEELLARDKPSLDFQPNPPRFLIS